jgi:hypothetical protein
MAGRGGNSTDGGSGWRNLRKPGGLLDSTPAAIIYDAKNNAVSLV